MALWDWMFGPEVEVEPTVQHRRLRTWSGEDLVHEWRQVATAADGEPVYAPVIALESGSIGAGGGGVASSVSVSNFPATQPVSGPLTDAELRATPVDIEGAVTGPLTNAELRALPVEVEGALSNVELRAEAVEVTGALTDGELRATPVAISGTVTANVGSGTQPISGTVTANVGTGTQPVSGTFWQATQPVSGTFWQATQPVSGTFWQATQPVSLAALPALSAGTANIGDVDVLTLPSLPAGTNAIGKLSANSGVDIGDVDVLSLPIANVASDVPITANPATVGGRASTAVPAAVSADGDAVNNWTDRRGAQVMRERTAMGRTRVVLKFHAAAPAVADTLLSTVKQSNGTDAGGATSIAVTANKILRITGVYVGVRAGAAAAAFAEITLRSNPAGATVIGSPSVLRIPVGVTAAVIGAAIGSEFTLPEGIEFTGAETLGISASAQAVTNVLSITLVGYEYDN